MNVSLEFFKAISQIENRYSCVLWMRDPSYQKQLYVSPSYECYWGYTPTSLYENPMSWQDTLVTNNRATLHNRLATRNTYANNENTETFCIKNKSKNLVWIRDKSFRINDANGNCQIVAGVGMPLDRTQLSDIMYQQATNYLLEQMTADFSETLYKYFDYRDESTDIKHILNKLSAREIQVLSRILQAKSAREIAKDLNISFRTVEMHTDNIKNKLNVKSKADIFIFCIENRLVSINFCS
ncbi:MAG: LuxR C-terminal-related transcriptional regulator [Gammaproteobacteria bacterium]